MLRFALLMLLAAPILAQGDTPAEPDAPAKDDAPAAKNPVVVMKTSMGDVHIELYPEAAPETVKNFIGLAEGTKEFTDVKTNEKVKRPYYDGLTFHRVIAGFMIQGGCPKGDGSGSPGYKFKDEINADMLGLDKVKAFEEGKGPHPWLGIRSRQQFNQMIVGPVVRKLGIKTNEEFQKRVAEVQAAAAKLTVKNVYENMGYKYDATLKSLKPTKGMLAMANAGPNTNGSQFFINLGDPVHLTGKHTVFGKVVKGMDIVEKIGAVAVGDGAKPVEPVTITSIRLLKAE